jgi:hypothetical protein
MYETWTRSSGITDLKGRYIYASPQWLFSPSLFWLDMHTQDHQMVPHAWLTLHPWALWPQGEGGERGEEKRETKKRVGGRGKGEVEERGRKKKRRLEGHEQGVINIKRLGDKQTR